MSHNNQKKIAAINDMTGFGRCALTVLLPVISHLKVQCCPVPTSIFSNHTAYPEYFFDDYTRHLREYMDNWDKLGLQFDGIVSGFLGSAEQIEIVKEFIHRFKKEKGVVIVDPVMGDDGKIYATYTEDMCKKMRELVAEADIVTPNVTELCVLTGNEYKEKWSRKELDRIVIELAAMGPEKIVVTGINMGIYIGNYVYEKGGQGTIVKAKKTGIIRCGTGDLFTSIIAADAVNGEELVRSVRKAAGFIKECIRISDKMQIPKEDGVAFEEILYRLK